MYTGMIPVISERLQDDPARGVCIVAGPCRRHGGTGANILVVHVVQVDVRAGSVGAGVRFGDGGEPAAGREEECHLFPRLVCKRGKLGLLHEDDAMAHGGGGGVPRVRGGYKSFSFFQLFNIHIYKFQKLKLKLGDIKYIIINIL